MKQEIKNALAGSKFAKASKDNPVKMDLKSRVTIYATDSIPTGIEGEEIQCSEILAAYMIGKGWATKDLKTKKEK